MSETNSPNDQEDSGSNMQSMKQIEEIRRELQDARKALHNAVSGANYALMRLSKLNYKLDDSEADRESSEGEPNSQAYSQWSGRMSGLWLGWRWGRTRWTWRPFGPREARCVYNTPAVGLTVGWSAP